MNVTLR
jgi:hypothetical protein